MSDSDKELFRHQLYADLEAEREEVNRLFTKEN